MSGFDRASVFVRDGSAAPGVFVCGTNPLRDEIDLSEVPDGAWLLCWSGSLADDMYARDWGTWGEAGMGALRSFCERAAAELGARGARLLLRPHARHVLSDAFKCRRFVDENPHACVGVALDAASMMERSMVGDAEGHYERAFEMLGPVAGAVVLSGVSAEGDEEEAMRWCRADAGVVGGAFVGEMMRAHVAAATAVVVMGEDAEGQLAGCGLVR